MELPVHPPYLTWKSWNMGIWGAGAMVFDSFYSCHGRPTPLQRPEDSAGNRIHAIGCGGCGAVGEIWERRGSL